MSQANKDIKLLIFDMGHVIIDFEWSVVCQGFLQRAGLARLEDFHPVLSEIGKLGYETGHVTTAQFLFELNRLLSTDISEDEFHRLWNATFRENEDMAGLLSQLKQKYPLYLLSNTNESHYWYIQNNFNVARHFDELLLSYELGWAKPEPMIYEEAIKRSGLDPQHCLFIDDLRANVEAARKSGMHAVLFTTSDDLLAELTALELID